MKEYTTEDILSLMDRFAQNKLTSFELNNGDFSLKLGKNQTVVAAAPVMQAAPAASAAPERTAEEEPAAKSGKVIKSPIVGTFYDSPAPDKPPFVKVGQKVSKGDVVFIVESMKLMNEITSEFDGVVSRVLVENAQPVEYGTPVLELE